MKIRTSLKALMVLAGVLFLLFYPVASKATTITFDYSFIYSGSPPAGSAPWLRATFDDVVSPGFVRLTMSVVGLTGNEFVEEWAFNLNPAKNPSSLIFTPVDITKSVPLISKGTDFYKADGDGYYDILFDFPPPPGTFVDKFTAGETVVIDIGGIAGLLASDFDFIGSPGEGGNAGPFKASAHLQRYADEGSGWATVAVPEPGILILLGIAMSAIGAASWRITKI